MQAPCCYENGSVHPGTPHLPLDAQGVGEQHVQLRGIQREQLALHRRWELSTVVVQALPHPLIVVVVPGALALEFRLGALSLFLQVLLQPLAAPLLWQGTEQALSPALGSGARELHGRTARLCCSIDKLWWHACSLMRPA